MFSVIPETQPFYSVILLATCSLLTVAYFVLWIKLRKQPNVDFAKKLTLCMMGFNLFIMTRFGIGKIISKDYCAGGSDGCKCSCLNACNTEPIYECQSFGASQVIGGVMWSLSIMAYLLCYNLGTWHFSFHFYKCHSEMPFALRAQQDKDAPVLLDEQREKNERRYKLGRAINVGAVLLYTALLLLMVSDSQQYAKVLSKNGISLLLTVTKIIVWICQLISFAFLLSSTLKIR
jgi:hypothetical protein